MDSTEFVRDRLIWVLVDRVILCCIELISAELGWLCWSELVCAGTVQVGMSCDVFGSVEMVCA
jgi:hypothetical protein